MVKYEAGDHVIYRKPKHSTHPGQRAENVHPAAAGEEYSYTVDKYWTVTRIVDPETLEVKTRTGKLHELRSDDPNLRKAGIFDELFRRNRFPET